MISTISRHHQGTDEALLLEEAKASVPVDIQGLIRSLDIEYVESDLEPGQSGRIEHTTDHRWVITVNLNEGPQRRKFTGAHELGHYFLHRDLLKPGGVHADRLFSPHLNKNVASPFTMSHERQANQFAATTIMPAALVRRYYEELQDATKMARFFEVSTVAMNWRLFNLGLIEERPA